MTTHLPPDPSRSLEPIHWRCVRDNRTWHVRVWPGPPPPAPSFLLVPGLGASPAYFHPLATRLAQLGMTYAPDLPGFGETERLRGEQSTIAIADALAALSRVINAGPMVVVAHSLGCQLAADLAARHPGIVGALVLISPAPNPHAGPLLCQALALAVDVPREPLALLALVVPDLLRAGPRDLVLAIRAMLKYRWRHDLVRITVPALVVRGERDPLVSHRWGATVARLISNGRLIEVPHAPHGVNFTHPAVIAVAIRELMTAYDLLRPAGQ